MKKFNVVITRHSALVEYFHECGYVTKDAQVLSHASHEDVAGKRVIGVLPVNMAVRTERFGEVPLDIPAELRGKELTLEEVRKYAGDLVEYDFTQTCWVTHEKPIKHEDDLMLDVWD